jgi:hypothetical protein
MEIDIIQAIKDKNLIEIYYEDVLLVVEPHWYGIDQFGHESLIAFQVESNYCKIDLGWKIVYLKKIAELNVLQETFESIRVGFKGNHFQSQKTFATL